MKVNAFTHDEFFHRINADLGRCDHKDRVSARPFVDPLRISTEMIVGAAIINVGLIDVKIPTLSIWNDLVRRGVEAFYCTQVIRPGSRGAGPTMRHFLGMAG